MQATTSHKQIIEDFLLKYLQLSDAKKRRVDMLFEFMKRSTDLDEQREIAQAIQEIVDPSDDYSLRPVDPNEGIRQDLKAKVEGYRKHIGRTIAERRKQLGMTQEQLAQKAGLPQSHISRLESGQHAPMEQTVERLAAALDTEPSKIDLLYDE